MFNRVVDVVARGKSLRTNRMNLKCLWYMQKEVENTDLELDEIFVWDIKILELTICKNCSVVQSYPTLCNPRDCSTPGLPVPHHLPEFAQVHVHCIGDAIQPSHPLIPSSPSAFNLSQHQGLFQWASCLHQVTKILEFQLQHQSFQWVFKVDFP